MQFVFLGASWKIANNVEHLVLQALHFKDQGLPQIPRQGRQKSLRKE
jgi:hypothetical protein